MNTFSEREMRKLRVGKVAGGGRRKWPEVCGSRRKRAEGRGGGSSVTFSASWCRQRLALSIELATIGHDPSLPDAPPPLLPLPLFPSLLLPSSSSLSLSLSLPNPSHFICLIIGSWMEQCSWCCMGTLPVDHFRWATSGVSLPGRADTPCIILNRPFRWRRGDDQSGCSRPHNFRSSTSGSPIRIAASIALRKLTIL